MWTFRNLVALGLFLWTRTWRGVKAILEGTR